MRNSKVAPRGRARFPGSREALAAVSFARRIAALIAQGRITLERRGK